MCDTHPPEDDSAPQRIGPSEFVRNLRQPGPLGWKLRRLLANTAIKVSHGQRCCGHAGEPGC
jgi:hypothetical protein